MRSLRRIPAAASRFRPRRFASVSLVDAGDTGDTIDVDMRISLGCLRLCRRRRVASFVATGCSAVFGTPYGPDHGEDRVTKGSIQLAPRLDELGELEPIVGREYTIEYSGLKTPIILEGVRIPPRLINTVPDVVS